MIFRDNIGENDLSYTSDHNGEFSGSTIPVEGYGNVAHSGNDDVFHSSSHVTEAWMMLTSSQTAGAEE